MGTYTTNKNLYMPTVGEQGWGTLVNGNFETIDNFLKPITVSGSTYTFTGNLVGNQSGGSISATSITNSGTLTNTGKITANGGIGTTSLTTSSTITSTGKITGNGGIGTTSLTTSSTITSTGLITANGGVKGNLTGNVTGFLFVKGTVGTSGDENYATLAAVSGTFPDSMLNSDYSFTIPNYTIVYGNPKKHSVGVYTRRSDLSGTTSPSAGTRTMTITNNNSAYLFFYYKLSTASNYTSTKINGSSSITINVTAGATYVFKGLGTKGTYSIPAGTTYKVKYATP